MYNLGVKDALKITKLLANTSKDKEFSGNIFKDIKEIYDEFNTINTDKITHRKLFYEEEELVIEEGCQFDFVCGLILDDIVKYIEKYPDRKNFICACCSFLYDNRFELPSSDRYLEMMTLENDIDEEQETIEKKCIGDVKVYDKHIENFIYLFNPSNDLFVPDFVCSDFKESINYLINNKKDLLDSGTFSDATLSNSCNFFYHDDDFTNSSIQMMEENLWSLDFPVVTTKRFWYEEENFAPFYFTQFIYYFQKLIYNG